MTSRFQILHEDNHLLVVNKPAGMLVQGDETGDEPLVELAKKYIGKKYNKPGAVFMGLPHRLDRPTSGVVVLARTSKALSRLTEMFRDKKVEKTYWAVVTSKPPKDEDTLIHYLRKNPEKNITTASAGPAKDAKEAKLTYKLVKELDGLYLLEVKLLTGRSHQIRAQLAAVRCPIAGDLKYGAKSALKDASIALHARELNFNHPVKKEPMHFKAPTPHNEVWKKFVR